MDQASADRLRELLDAQAGVVGRRQLLDGGLAPHDIRRLVRRKELAVVHAGVYVEHTGPLTGTQRTWAAVLACWPAALCHESALPGSPDPAVVHVAVDHRRTVVAPPGVVVHRMAALDERVRWNASPPRLRVEHAAIDVAASRGDVASQFEVLDHAVESAGTTVRLTYGLVFRHGCRTIHKIARLLNQRGWPDVARSCPDCVDS